MSNIMRDLHKIRQQRRLDTLDRIFIHKVNKNGQPSKVGTLFGSAGYHAATPEAECERMEALNLGSKFVVIREES